MTTLYYNCTTRSESPRNLEETSLCFAKGSKTSKKNKRLLKRETSIFSDWYYPWVGDMEFLLTLPIPRPCPFSSQLFYIWNWLNLPQICTLSIHLQVKQPSRYLQCNFSFAYWAKGHTFPSMSMHIHAHIYACTRIMYACIMRVRVCDLNLTL